MTRRITILRAVLALVWAAAVVLALDGRVPSSDADVPLLVAALLTTYPLIDVVASLATGARAGAAVSAVAAVAIGVTAFGADAGTAMAAFGAWAAVSGGIQFALAVRRRRAGEPQLAMLISGGLSTVAGLGFLAAAGMDDAHLVNLAGYMAAGAVLYLVSARRPLDPVA